MKNNNGVSIKSVDLLEAMIDNRCGKDSFESRLYRHIMPHIKIQHPKETNLTHEEEICLSLADHYNN